VPNAPHAQPDSAQEPDSTAVTALLNADRHIGRAAGGHGNYGLFVLPAMLLVAFVVLVPAVLTFIAAFTDWDGVSKPLWVGLDNFRDLLTDMSFWRAIFNNVKWTILFLTIPAIMALVIASLLLTRKRSHGVYQIIFLLPYALSPIANALVWRYMIFDHVFGVAGYVEKHISWVTDPLGHVSTALYAVAAVDIWHFWGYLTVVFFAAMRQVPGDQLEAAIIEGANGWQVFRHITLPNILPTIALMFVLVTIFSFLTFDYVYLMTGGGPAHATELLSTLGYGFAFRTFEVGKAAAVALFMSLFGFIAACVYVQMSRESLKR
jgi:raffinose/stachyose/melibiose transport system permease protein